jgi:hypothetical protein
MPKPKKPRGLEVYDELRMFHKNTLFEIMDKYELTEYEKDTLETLSGVLYLVEGVMCREENRI